MENQDLAFKTSQKRSGDDASDVRKKSKYQTASIPFLITPGMTGYFITCNRKGESRAVNEALEVFEHFALKYYGPLNVEIVEDTPEEETSVEDAFAKELAELKKPIAHKKFAARFKQLRLPKIECVTFIQTPMPPIADDTVAFITRLANDLVAQNNIDESEAGSRKIWCRHIQRVMPIQVACSVKLEIISTTLKELCRSKLPSLFNADDNTQITFACVYRHRNNDSLDRDELQRTVAGIVGSFAGGSRFVVDWKNPQVTVLLEVLQSICGMAIIPDFNKLKKLNLQELSRVPDIK